MQDDQPSQPEVTDPAAEAPPAVPAVTDPAPEAPPALPEATDPASEVQPTQPEVPDPAPEAPPTQPGATDPASEVQPTQPEVTDPAPEAQPPQSEATAPTPEAESPQSEETDPAPEAQPPEPEATDAAPETEPAQPEVTDPAPEAQPPESEATDPAPEAEPAQPEMTEPAPEMQPPQPDATDPAPGVELAQPEVTDPAPEAQPPESEATDPAPEADPPQPEVTDPAPEAQPPQSDATDPVPEPEMPARDNDTPLPEIESLNAIVEDELRYQNILGGAVAVVRDGVIVHARGYGFTSPTMDVPITTETVFRWASISKPLTAIAILQLDEATDRFSIDDSVSTHVDYWPSDTSNKANITIRQLLSHRSGVISYRSPVNCPDNSSPDFDVTAHGDVPFNARNAVEVFAQEPLCFSPDNSYKYSTFGFSLAAAAMEKEAGQSYTDWVQERIAAPLDMQSLAQGTGISTGYGARGCGELREVTEASKSYVLPGGGWASNVTDLAKFANGILQGTLLNNTERLWSEPTGNSNTYRLGIELSLDSQRAWHSGGHSDLRTYMHLYHAREDKVGIVVYLNHPYADPERMVRRVADGLGISSWNVPLDAGCQ